jgi:hypothetical protein
MSSGVEITVRYGIVGVCGGSIECRWERVVSLGLRSWGGDREDCGK